MSRREQTEPITAPCGCVVGRKVLPGCYEPTVLVLIHCAALEGESS